MPVMSDYGSGVRLPTAGRSGRHLFLFSLRLQRRARKQDCVDAYKYTPGLVFDPQLTWQKQRQRPQTATATNLVDNSFGRSDPVQTSTSTLPLLVYDRLLALVSLVDRVFQGRPGESQAHHDRHMLSHDQNSAKQQYKQEENQNCLYEHVSNVLRRDTALHLDRGCDGAGGSTV